MTSPTTMTRRPVPRPLPWPALMFTLILALVLAACSSIAGPSAPTTAGGPSADPPSTGVVDPATEILELHYVRSTIAGRQAEHTAVVRGDGQVRLADEIDGTEHRFTLTQTELARIAELLPMLADAPEPTSAVSDVGRIDARFPLGGREVAFSIEDWSMAGGTSRLPADERAVADAMIELRDLLIREPAAGSTSGSAPSTAATSTG